MTSGLDRLRGILDAEGVDYQVLHHEVDYHAKKTAEDTHTPPDEFAKTVFVWMDGSPAMAVVAADQGVSLGKLKSAAGVEEVRLAHESDVRELCPDCETGAAPPFGNLYSLPVFVSTSLAEDEKITFNGGTHEVALRMAFADFERLVQPKIVKLARND